MRILLCCETGASSSILIDKIDTYCKQQEIDCYVEARPVQEFNDVAKNFDIVLLGPQVSYKAKQLAMSTTVPVEVISGLDYAFGEAENIVNMVKKRLAI